MDCGVIVPQRSTCDARGCEGLQTPQSIRHTFHGKQLRHVSFTLHTNILLPEPYRSPSQGRTPRRWARGHATVRTNSPLRTWDARGRAPTSGARPASPPFPGPITETGLTAGGAADRRVLLSTQDDTNWPGKMIVGAGGSANRDGPSSAMTGLVCPR